MGWVFVLENRTRITDGHGRTLVYMNRNKAEKLRQDLEGKLKQRVVLEEWEDPSKQRYGGRKYGSGGESGQPRKPE